MDREFSALCNAMRNETWLRFTWDVSGGEPFSHNPFRVSFRFRPANNEARDIGLDYLVSRSAIQGGALSLAELKEQALLACLERAYPRPKPPRSLWWHLRAWWRGQ